MSRPELSEDHALSVHHDRPVLVPAPAAAPSPRDLLAVFEHAPLGIAVVTGEGRITGCNRALGRLLGHAPADLLGRTLFAFTEPEDLPGAHQRCVQVQQGGEDQPVYECRLRTATGQVVWVGVSASRLEPDPDPRSSDQGSVILHVQDVGERKALEAELRRQALHDDLTGLPNRALVLDRTEHALAHSRRTGSAVSLLFLDLDGFKTVNDAHGHGCGDLLLQQLAQRITRALRPGDSAARLGGDEFVVLCPGTDAAQGDDVAQRLREQAGREFDLGGVRVTLGAAVGRATVRGSDAPQPDALALLEQADAAMYLAKRRRQRRA